MPLRARHGVLRLGLLGLALLSGPASALTNEECLECHREPSLSMVRPDGAEVSVFVDEATYDRSVHAGFSCTDCHEGIEEFPHDEVVDRVDCGSCHSDVVEHYAASSHGEALAGGNPDAPTCADCHGKHDILGASDPESRVSYFKLVETCAHCHADLGISQRLPFGNRTQVASYLKSVHGKALLEDRNPNAPNCGTCHPAHDIRLPTDPESSVHRLNLAETCAQCHFEIYEVYSASVHGEAFAAGNQDSPTCSGCHGEHLIEGPESPTSTIFPENIVKTTCTRCHSSLVLSQRYGFDATRLATYRETYHGLAGRKGDLSVANCASCHGVHDIYPSADPRSTVNKDNLTETCGSCHPNANARFASISVHPRISGDAQGPQPPEVVVRWVYVVLIVAVIGGMAAHNLVIWFFYVLEKIRRDRQRRVIRRFTRFEAVEHTANLIAFFTLVITGFALKFPDASWVHLTERLGLTEDLRGLIHRIMAVAMMVVAVSHTCYLLFTRRGRRDLISLMPRLSDVRDFLHTMAYHLRLRRDRPLYPRFDYTEKAEYLALIWGTSVMILTGLILWFPTIASRYLPTWAFRVAEVIHYYEAWLAFLAILVWHFFFVFLHPEIYPMNTTWLDGRTTEEHALHKHGKVEEDA